MRKITAAESYSLEAFGELARAARMFPETSVKFLPESLLRLNEFLANAEMALPLVEKAGSPQEKEIARRIRRLISAVKAAIAGMTSDKDVFDALLIELNDYDRFIFG